MSALSTDHTDIARPAERYASDTDRSRRKLELVMQEHNVRREASDEKDMS